MTELLTPTFAAIWLGWLLAEGTPGPTTLSISGTAMARGRLPALAVALGVVAGSAALGIASVLGLGALMVANQWVFETIRYVGAAYLMWLAVQALRAGLAPSSAPASKPFKGTASALFAKGALLHLTNPKAILAWGAIFSIALPPNPTAGMLFECFGLLFAGSVCVHLSYVVLFSTPAVVAVYIRAGRIFHLGFAAFLGFASFKILTARLAQ